jgi:hypothetical protein
MRVLRLSNLRDDKLYQPKIGAFIVGLAVLVMAVMMGTGAARAEGAIGWVGDLPVPASALIETSGAVNFDSPSGRVIQFTFLSDMSAEEVTSFYRTSLAELGWQATDSGFVRGDEHMIISPAAAKSAASGNAYFVEVKPRD